MRTDPVLLVALVVDAAPPGLVLRRLTVIAARAVPGAVTLAFSRVFAAHAAVAVPDAASLDAERVTSQDSDVTLVEVAAAVVASGGQDPTGC